MAKKHAPYKPLKKGTTQPAQQPPVSLKPDMGPGSFIVINILIHSLNTILMCWLTNRLSDRNAWVAFFTALLWGIHPMHVESVVGVSERKDVLNTLFFWRPPSPTTRKRLPENLVMPLPGINLVNDGSETVRQIRPVALGKHFSNGNNPARNDA